MSELSYAYLHAIAASAGISCKVTDRHDDGIGIDAQLRCKEKFAADSFLTQFAVDVQLKATAQDVTYRQGRFSYPLDLKNYDELRAKDCGAPQLLVVLFLPQDEIDWLSHSVESLICRKCAYWLSLRGAGASQNDTSQTVYIPDSHGLSTANLRNLMTRFSRQEDVKYEP